MGNLCIITARGGSKRIPRKNIKPFLGKPIIAYSIEAALNSKLFDEVMVSTDDDEIAEIAHEYGANIPFKRSSENSDDYATTFDVIEEVLNQYKVELNQTFEFACCIYPTAPFVNAEILSSAFSLLGENRFDSVFPVMPFSFPVQRALKLSDAGNITFFNQEFATTRSQDLEKSYHDAGQFYWINVEECLKSKKLITENSGSIVISELQGQDIDNETDWKLAELKYELL
ncbi:pseudaminic acid cytidylyltransferase [Nonlabens sp.]|uniref:pseudaminic acid cytidylyltransferase n=1 Tax=Nonlabens sp. TaxID=1888209 RepID=UPI003F69F5B9